MFFSCLIFVTKSLLSILGFFGNMYYDHYIEELLEINY